MKFRTKPTEVEAVRWDPSGINKAGGALRWMLERNIGFTVQSDGYLLINQVENLFVSPGDWIVESDTGIAKYTNDIFTQKFTEVTA